MKIYIGIIVLSLGIVLFAQPISIPHPYGSDTEVQYNDGGVFGGDPNFTFDDVNNILTVGDSNSANWETAHTHSQDNTQAHSDYTINTGDTVTGDYNFGSGLFFVDDTNDKIGIGTTSAASTSFFEIESSTDEVVLYLRGTSATGVYYKFAVDCKNATDRAFGTTVDGSNYGSFVFLANGQLEWGSGAAGRDTNLYRSAANKLTTDDWFGIGTTPEGQFHTKLAGGSLTDTALFERTTTSTSSAQVTFRTLATTSNNMADNFGVLNGYSIRDSANVINQIAYIGAVRVGADNSGAVVIYTVNAGSASEKVRVLPDGGVKLNNVKSGATQAAAGAAANEIWKTSSHATLPDGVLMIGS